MENFKYTWKSIKQYDEPPYIPHPAPVTINPQPILPSPYALPVLLQFTIF